MLKLSATLAAVIVSGTAASAATLSGIGTFDGVAGIGTSNGDVGDSPVGSSYVYVTTAESNATGIGYGLGSETNGSQLTTSTFEAEAGAELSYYFNYVTSDGSGFADYAFALLEDSVGGVTNLFNARTTELGDTVPGFGLPAIDAGVTLNPASTPIIDNATNWAELGVSSGGCYAEGCGSTGWIQSTFTIQTAGTYSFTFGVTNWSDQALQSGLAIAGLSIGEEVIIPDNPVAAVPLPAAGWMLLAGVAGMSMVRRRR